MHLAYTYQNRGGLCSIDVGDFGFSTRHWVPLSYDLQINFRINCHDFATNGHERNDKTSSTLCLILPAICDSSRTATPASLR